MVRKFASEQTENSGELPNRDTSEKCLHFAATVLCNVRSVFARACGRVSIGGHPDKRPDSRLEKHLLL